MLFFGCFHLFNIMIASSQSKPLDTLLTAEGLSQHLPYSARSLRRMADDGEIPSYKIGGRKKTLFRPTEVIASMTRKSSTSEVLR